MENISQMSLLEVAVLLMEQKKNKQPIMNLIKEVLEMKGLDDEDSVYATQLYIDITTSSKFVYMGDGEWDLKIRQSLDQYDKDGSAFNSKDEIYEETEENQDDIVEDYDVEDDEESDDEYDDEYEDDEYEDEDEEDDDEYEYEDEDDYISDDILDDAEVYSEDDFNEDQYNDLMDDYEDMYE